MLHLLQGLVIGFLVAAPVGPVGLLCIRRAILDGRLAGFVTGAGAAVADALFGLVAALGLTSVTHFLSRHEGPFHAGAGLLLLGIGVVTMASRPPSPAVDAAVPTPDLTRAFFSTLGITLANPMTIAGFIAIFTGFGVGLRDGTAWQTGWLVLGVLLGSAAWWLLLSGIAGWLAPRLRSGGLALINLVTGALIAAYGVWQLGRLLVARHT